MKDRDYINLCMKKYGFTYRWLVDELKKMGVKTSTGSLCTYLTASYFFSVSDQQKKVISAAAAFFKKFEQDVTLSYY